MICYFFRKGEVENGRGQKVIRIVISERLEEFSGREETHFRNCTAERNLETFNSMRK